MKALLATLALALLAGTASADTLMNYKGNSVSDPQVNFPNPCGCAMDISLRFDDTGLLTAWNFSAGGLSVDQTDSTIGTVHLSDFDTLFGGNPINWNFNVVGANVDFFSNFYGSQFEETDSVGLNGQSFQLVQGNMGVWTETQVPEPGTLALLLLPVLGLLRRRNPVN
jgi:hypothetical protein